MLKWEKYHREKGHGEKSCSLVGEKHHGHGIGWENTYLRKS